VIGTAMDEMPMMSTVKINMVWVLKDIDEKIFYYIDFLYWDLKVI
jgi:hypothetical protein